ncbi:MAG: hypothetical protein ABEI52_02195 [Halobacteriaceae archaeon]
MSQSITIPVADECEHRDCGDDPEFAYVVNGEVGTDGVAVYCGFHAETFADTSTNHTALTTL